MHAMSRVQSKLPSRISDLNNTMNASAAVFPHTHEADRSKKILTQSAELVPFVQVLMLLLGDCFGAVDSRMILFESISPAHGTDSFFLVFELSHVRVRVCSRPLHLLFRFLHFQLLFLLAVHPWFLRLHALRRLIGVHHGC